MEAVLSPVDATFPLESILSTKRLGERARRAPDYAGESKALNDLARELAKPAGNILKKLTDSALALCRAQTAGISILEMCEGRRVFRWHAVSGRWAEHEGGSMPREASPCGTILDRNHHELMAAPERHYLAMRGVEPSVSEVLLMPFNLLGTPVGTIWVIAHDDSVRFDDEDLRLMGNLASFAATAYVLHSSLRLAQESNQELSRMNARLLKSGPPG
jgi:hypothetical protein